MAALRSLAPTWASELRDRKIRVYVISPDATETPGINTLAGTLNPGPNAAGDFENYQRSIVPLARYATAEEVANAALSLASDLSSFTTGAEIPSTAASTRSPAASRTYPPTTQFAAAKPSPAIAAALELPGLRLPQIVQTVLEGHRPAGDAVLQRRKSEVLTRTAAVPGLSAWGPEIAGAVQSGQIGNVIARLPAPARQVVGTITRAAFTAGLDRILLVAAIIAFAAGVVSLAAIRSRDFARATPGGQEGPGNEDTPRRTGRSARSPPSGGRPRTP
jgi:Enoyl-(Acyl carrier protein) reductase